jgi:hypothetical protein
MIANDSELNQSIEHTNRMYRAVAELRSRQRASAAKGPSLSELQQRMKDRQPADKP